MLARGAVFDRDGNAYRLSDGVVRFAIPTFSDFAPALARRGRKL